MYNWYWLVDGLMDNGHQIHLANTAAIQQDVIEGEISSSSAAFLGIALLCIDGVDFAAAEIGLHD
jgi:hypothetical protein